MIYYYGSCKGLILKTCFVARRDRIESLDWPFIRMVDREEGIRQNNVVGTGVLYKDTVD